MTSADVSIIMGVITLKLQLSVFEDTLKRPGGVYCGSGNQGFRAGAGVFGSSRSRHFGSILNICLIIHANYMELNLI